ncbi:hypothetical protein DWV34_06215 [Anaerostipes sp. AF04-45]|nr:hypothetical protein DWV34_06215 [Anaerostipes sp. AF04-45]
MIVAITEITISPGTLVSGDFLLSKNLYVFLTIFLYLRKCPQSIILSALRAFCFCGKPYISRSILGSCSCLPALCRTYGAAYAV